MTCMLFIALCVGGTRIRAQDSEYSQPSFDAEHDYDSFIPVENIDLFSGALTLVYTDIALPGPNGFDLNITRWYSSKINKWNDNCTTRTYEETPVGIGWQMHMGRLWDNPTTGGIPAYRLELPGGQSEEFYTDNTLQIPNADYVSRGAWILFDEPGFQTVVSPSGIKYRFSTAASNRFDPNNDYLYLTQMIDPIGNLISMTYEDRGDNNAYLKTVTDDFGRIATFFYQNNTVHVADPDRLDSVTVKDHNGATATYDYTVLEPAWTSHTLLGSFELPVGLTTSYDYSLQAGESTADVELKRLDLPTGGTIEYDYQQHEFYYPLRNVGSTIECTRVVTTKTVGGNALWTFDYPEGTPTDRTTVVTDPHNHQQKYTFYRYAASGPDRIWKTGLLERRDLLEGSTTELLREDYVYEAQEYSADNVSPKSGYYEPANVALLIEKTTTYRGTKSARVTWGGHDEYANPATMNEYNFNNSLYRTTGYEYEHGNGDSDDSTFENAHLVNRITRTTVDNFAGTLLAETRLNYDAVNGAGKAFGNVEFEERWYDALDKDTPISGYTRTEYDYDTGGDITATRVIDPQDTRTTNFVYDRGVLKTVTIDGMVIMNRIVDTHTSVVESQTDANGFTTTFGYDSWNRLTSMVPPLGATTTIAYDNVDADAVTVNRGIGQVLYTYDDFGRLTQNRTKLEGSIYSYEKVEFDEKGQLKYRYEASTSPSSTIRTTFLYDGLGRIKQASDPDGTSFFVYGADTTTVTDPASQQTVHTLDAFGRLIQVREPGNHTTTYAYNELDQLTGVIHPGTAGNRSFDLNSLGWLLEETNPESGTTRYAYNEFGNLEWKRDATGYQSIYTYDARGRLDLIDFPTGTDVQFYYDGDLVPGHSATYVNGDSELTGMSDETGTTLWTDRDVLGRVTRVERKLGATTYVLDYDDRGNLDFIDYPRPLGAPSRTQVQYTYNEANLIKTITLNGATAFVTDVDYNPALTPSRFTYANGVTVEIPTSSALRNRPDLIYTTGVTTGGSPHDLSLNYRYNSRGLIDQVVTNGRTDTYLYTPKGLLDFVEYGTSGSQGTIDYAYDATGNMLSRQSTAVPSLNFSHTYSSNRVVGFNYSTSGNLQAEGTQNYTYTAHDKLRGVTGVSQYYYTGQGVREEAHLLVENLRRLEVHDEQQRLLTRFTGPLVGTAEPERDFIFAGSRVVGALHHQVVNDVGNTLILNPTGNDEVVQWNPPPDGCVTSYEVLRSLDPSFASYSVLTDPPTAATTYTDPGVRSVPTDYFYRVRAVVTTPSWFVLDHRGSVRMVLDNGGEVQAEYETFPYGEPKVADCDQWAGGYQGVLREEETGLYDLGVRHYTPGLARFLVPDRIEPSPRLPLSWNPYLYSASDPMNLLDLDGLAARTANGGINYLRNITITSDTSGFLFNVEIGLNAVTGSVSDALGLDTIADGIAVAANTDLTGKDRVWGGSKAAGTAALDVAGGVVVKRVVGGLWRLAKVFGKARSAPTAGVEALEQGAAAVIPEGSAARGGARALELAPRVARQLADPRLGPLAGKLTGPRLQQLVNNPAAQRFLDASTGHINVIQEVDGVLLRITTRAMRFESSQLARSSRKVSPTESRMAGLCRFSETRGHYGQELQALRQRGNGSAQG